MAAEKRTKRWLYDSGAARYKHRWSKEQPGFEQLPCGTWVGKCPANVSQAEAEDLINSGVEESSGLGDAGVPDMIFVIRENYVYRAYPTQPGVSYHAFPECPRRLKTLPKSVRAKIVALAEEKGCGERVRRVVGLKK